jgi:hypothetical protein
MSLTNVFKITSISKSGVFFSEILEKEDEDDHLTHSSSSSSNACLIKFHVHQFKFLLQLP